MKILVMSDTHGNIDKAEEAVRCNRGVDLIIHLGDYFRDAQRLSDIFPEIPMEYVYGNGDFMIGDIPCEKILEFEGKRIFITHGHRYSVKWGHEKLFKKAEEMYVDLILFGHTHVTEMQEQNGCVLLNPGSISDSRNSMNESYAIVEIKKGKIEARITYI